MITLFVILQIEVDSFVVILHYLIFTLILNGIPICFICKSWNAKLILNLWNLYAFVFILNYDCLTTIYNSTPKN